MSIPGAELIAIERRRQIEVEGWDANHDSGHTDELALAGACYALPREERDTETYVRGRTRTILSELWPWPDKSWKPVASDGVSVRSYAEARARELVKAGALIAAAIDSLQDAS